MNLPTYKQSEAIKGIETVLCIKFEGESRQDAFFFIRDNIDKAREKALLMHRGFDIQKNNRDMAHIEFYNNANNQTRHDTMNSFDVPDDLFDLIDKE